MPAATLAPDSIDRILSLSMPTLVDLARSLGFSFTRSADDPTDVTVTPPKPTGPDTERIVAVHLRVSDPANSTALLAAVHAAGVQASPLRSAPPKPPRKLGTCPTTGRPLPAPNSPPPPEAPHLLTFTPYMAPVDSLSAAEVEQETRSISTEWAILDRKLAALPTEVEEEGREVQVERERIAHRMRLLSERAFGLEERRQREMFARVDECERERQLAEHAGRPRLVVNWHSGRTIPSA